MDRDSGVPVIWGPGSVSQTSGCDGPVVSIFRGEDPNEAQEGDSMTRFRLGLAVAALISLAGSATAQGQYFGRTTPAGTPVGPQGMTPMQMVTNPYLNPSINPFLGQSVGNNPVAPGNAALYYFMAQQQAASMAQQGRTGWLGSRNTKPVARSSYATNVPGGGASSYFQGGWTSSPSTSKFFNRTQGHYMNSRGNPGR